MLTKSGISIITSGLAGSNKVGSPETMETNPEDYLWLKSPSGKFICREGASGEYADRFIVGSSTNPFQYNENHRTVTDANLLLKNNSDVDSVALNSNDSYSFCHYTLLLGTGTTAPTVDDYKLVNCETRYVRKQESMYFDSKNLQCQISMIIQPTDTLTIKEIGCYARCFSGYPNDPINANINCLSLIDRKVLTEPLVITAGSIYTVTYTIDFRNINEATA